MTRTRWRKVIGDLAQRRGRSLLTLFGLSLGLIFVGAVVTAFTILGDDLDANFRSTNPPNITLSATDVSADLQARIAAIPGVTGVDERPEFGALIQTRPDRWWPLMITVVKDFQHLRIARFDSESGAWPPAPGNILIERDGRWFFAEPPLQPLKASLPIRLPNGAIISSAFAGYVFDAGQHPSRMEQVLYGYITPETLANWSYSLKGTRLLITTTPAAAVGAGQQIEALFHEAGVKLAGTQLTRLVVRSTPTHGHKFQFDTILTLLAGLAAVALVMCAVLIVNLIDSLMATQQRAIGVLRALGARSGQIVLDYALGMGVLGLLAGVLALYPSLWAGKTIARFVAMGLNFNVLSPSGPVWLPVAVVGIGIVIPMSVALSAIYRAAYKPARQALAHGDAGQAFPFADGFGALMTFLPLVPRMAIRSIARKPRKVLLSALILSLGLAFCVTALTIRASMLSTVDSVRRTKSFDVAVSLRAAEPIEGLNRWMTEIPGVRHREYWSVAEGTMMQAGLRVSNPISIIGVADDSQSIHPDIRAGEWIALRHSGIAPTGAVGIVANQMLLKDEPGLHLGGTYEMKVDDRSVDVTVIGVVQEFNPGQIYCPKSLLDRLLNQDGRANAIVLTLEDGSFDAQRRAATLIQTSATGPDRQISGVLLTRMLEMIILGHLEILTGLLMLIALIALTVGALGLASTISISVVERYREIAVLKAIGGRCSSIATLFTTEAVAIGLIGWALSVALTPLLSHPVVSILGSAVIHYKFEYRASPTGAALALCVALLVALLAAILPVRAAIGLTIRNGLRTE